MGALAEKKIDCHNHILDPDRYPYSAETRYRPAGQEIGTEAQLHTVCDVYGVDHCLVVGPNSGYGLDNRCLLDAIKRSNGRFKGVAVVGNDATTGELADLKARGVVGIAFNATYHSPEFYADTGPLLKRLAALGLFAQVQVEQDQLVALMPLIERSDAMIVIDHCGRPDLSRGLDAPGHVAMQALARRGNAAVKLSGLYKFSGEAFPYRDTWPIIRDLVGHFGLDRCVWGSDWPYLRAPRRIDYGPLLHLVDMLFADEGERRRVLWETPKRLFGFHG
jgi:predicted TIM-barrel fold metal-dependent hydrolase